MPEPLYGIDWSVVRKQTLWHWFKQKMAQERGIVILDEFAPVENPDDLTGQDCGVGTEELDQPLVVHDQ